MIHELRGIYNDGLPTPYLHPFAKIIRWVDPDTVEIEISAFDHSYRLTVRLHGVDGPETRLTEGVTQSEKEFGLLLTKMLNDSMPEGTPVVFQSIKDRREKYGRYLGVIWHDGDNVNDRINEASKAWWSTQ